MRMGNNPMTKSGSHTDLLWSNGLRRYCMSKASALTSFVQLCSALFSSARFDPAGSNRPSPLLFFLFPPQELITRLNTHWSIVNCNLQVPFLIPTICILFMENDTKNSSSVPCTLYPVLCTLYSILCTLPYTDPPAPAPVPTLALACPRAFPCPAPAPVPAPALVPTPICGLEFWIEGANPKWGCSVHGTSARG